MRTRAHKNGVVLEVELARKYQKLVVGLPTFGAAHMAPEAAALVDVQCPWDAKQIIAALEFSSDGVILESQVYTCMPTESFAF